MTKGSGRGHVPRRTCIVCGTKDSKAVMVRLVAAPDGVRLDPTGGASGRGAYVCRRPQCDKTLLRARRLSYALRTQVPESLTRELVSDLLSHAPGPTDGPMLGNRWTGRIE